MCGCMGPSMNTGSEPVYAHRMGFGDEHSVYLQKGRTMGHMKRASLYPLKRQSISFLSRKWKRGEESPQFQWGGEGYESIPICCRAGYNHSQLTPCSKDSFLQESTDTLGPCRPAEDTGERATLLQVRRNLCFVFSVFYQKCLFYSIVTSFTGSGSVV